MYLKSYKTYIDNYKKRRNLFVSTTLHKPSSVNEWMKCPGYIYIEDAKATKEQIEGRKIHKELHKDIVNHIKAQRFKRIKIIEPQFMGDPYIATYIHDICDIAIRKKPTIIGIEQKVLGRLKHHVMSGIPDCFYLIDNKLYVLDLKTGWKDKYSHNQLKIYAFLIIEHFNIEPISITTSLYSRNGKDRLEHSLTDIMAYKAQISQHIDQEARILKPTLSNCTECYKLTKCVKGSELILKIALQKEKKLSRFEDINLIKKSINKLYDSIREEAIDFFKNKEFKKLKELDVNIKETTKIKWNEKSKEYIKLLKDIKNMKVMTPLQLLNKGVKVSKEAFNYTTEHKVEGGYNETKLRHTSKGMERDFEEYKALQK